MAKLDIKAPRAARMRAVEGVTGPDRKQVIIMAQIVTIVALLVVWSLIKNRRSTSTSMPTDTPEKAPQAA